MAIESFPINTQSISTGTRVDGNGTPGSPIDVPDDAIDNAGLANMPAKTYKGRTTASTGDPENVPVATVQEDLSVDHLITLSGVPEGSDDNGTFTGTTIPDNSTTKAALQALETAVESAGGETNTASNVGTGEGGVYKQKTGADIELRTIKAGSNITVTQNADDITIDATDTGEANTASNVGTGEGIYKQKTGADLELKTLVAGANITITNNANDLTIAASGGSSFAWYDMPTDNIRVKASADPTTWYTRNAAGDYTIALPNGGKIKDVKFTGKATAGAGQNMPSGTFILKLDYTAVTGFTPTRSTIGDLPYLKGMDNSGDISIAKGVTTSSISQNLTISGEVVTLNFGSISSAFSDGSEIIIKDLDLQ